MATCPACEDIPCTCVPASPERTAFSAPGRRIAACPACEETPCTCATLSPERAAFPAPGLGAPQIGERWMLRPSSSSTEKKGGKERGSNGLFTPTSSESSVSHLGRTSAGSMAEPLASTTMQSVMGRFERTDRIPPPILGPDETWTFHISRVMSDAAFAIEPAVEAALPGIPPPEFDKCSVHAGPIWLDKHRSDFVNYAANHEAIANDIEKYKTIPFASAARTVFNLMLHKWAVVYEEKVVATRFKRAWEGAQLTWIECNSGPNVIVAGGSPNHNNGCEGSNNDQKREVGWKTLILKSYLSPNEKKGLVAHIASKSRRDKEFCLKLSPMVNKSVFYTQVHKIATQDISPLTISFSCETFGAGVRIFTSDKTLDYLRENCHLKTREQFLRAISVAACTRQGAMSTSQRPGGIATWLNTFLLIARDPASILGGMDFDLACSWMESFHIMRPIIDEPYLQNQHARLSASGLTMEPLQLLLRRGIRGLMSCGCKIFLHFAWCQHSCADAIQKRIVVSIPRNMDPTVLRSRKRGRPVLDSGRVKATSKRARSKGTKRNNPAENAL
jgi:hypothetical protein